jgi:hypothetical protein
MDAEALASIARSKPSSSDDNGCSSEGEQSRWSDLDEQHLLTYRKEGMP